MALFLSTYTGTGTREDPFSPVGLDEPGVSAIDIRLNALRADGGGIGFALLWVPTGIPDPVGAIKIADDYGDLLTSQQRTRLNQRTGLDFGADTTIQDALETIMLRADVPGAGMWKRIRPSRGQYEVWLGSGTGKRLWVNLPAIGGGTISDNFNRSDETPLASPWEKWSGSGGQLNLSSNAVTHSATADTLYYYVAPGGWDADQSSEWSYVTGVTNNDWAVAVRCGVGAFTAYIYNQYTGGGIRRLQRVVSGSFTTIENATGTGGSGSTYKLDVAGSTLRYYDGGAENASSPGTDTNISAAGNGAGIFVHSSGGSYDDFVATGDVNTGGANKLMLLGVGGMVRVAAIARLTEPVNRRTLGKLLGCLWMK